MTCLHCSFHPSSIGRTSVVVLTLLLMTGCSMFQAKPKDLAPSYKLKHWSIDGKIGAKTPDESGSGILSWEESDQNYHIWVSGPLGRGSVEVIGKPQQVTLITPSGKFQDKDPRSLLMTHLGWDFPIEMVRYWVRGLPAPQHDYAWKKDSNSNVLGFSQANWDIDLDHYAPVKGYNLPHKIKISRPQWRFTLIVKKWTLDKS